VDIIIKPLQKRDFDAARKFAIDGMHLTWYTSNKLELYLYSKYFWCMEICRATTALGAYQGDKLIGVLLSDMKGKQKVYNPHTYRAFVKFAAFIINLGYKYASTYDMANKEMFEAYRKENAPDGELNFFAVDPDTKGKGIGTLLLNELERQESGKYIHLFTDSGSTYQFYTRRGFAEVGRKDITMKIQDKDVDLTCLLFSKRLDGGNNNKC
jgi:ribosomal protein S18 acetylase RimI-like enzyme